MKQEIIPKRIIDLPDRTKQGTVAIVRESSEKIEDKAKPTKWKSRRFGPDAHLLHRGIWESNPMFLEILETSVEVDKLWLWDCRPKREDGVPCCGDDFAADTICRNESDSEFAS